MIILTIIFITKERKLLMLENELDYKSQFAVGIKIHCSQDVKISRFSQVAQNAPS